MCVCVCVCGWGGGGGGVLVHECVDKCVILSVYNKAVSISNGCKISVKRYDI